MIEKTRTPGQPLWKRLLWFVLIWILSVAALGIVAYGLRLWLKTG